jgi:transcriptional regulator with XRE-family HTH domain
MAQKLPKNTQNYSQMEQPELSKVIGKNLRFFRKKWGLNQNQIGKILGVSYQQVQKYEKGISRIPIDSLYCLACHFNIQFDSFFSAAEHPYNISRPEDHKYFSQIVDAYYQTDSLKQRQKLAMICKILTS